MQLRTKRQIVAVLTLVLTLLVAGPVAARNENPGVIPPHAKAFGKSYEDWSAAWWRWVYSLPLAHHPLVGGGKIDCSLGQQGKVWFLGGIFGVNGANATATRSCSIPTGVALFFPILNSEADNFNVDLDTGQALPPTTFSKQELEQFCDQNVAHPQNLAVTRDGQSLQRLVDYKITPTPFSYTAPPDNIYDLLGFDISGPVPPPGAVSCGYFVMLTPLSAGEHTLRIEATNHDASFILDVTYYLTVEPRGRINH